MKLWVPPKNFCWNPRIVGDTAGTAMQQLETNRKWSETKEVVLSAVLQHQIMRCRSLLWSWDIHWRLLQKISKKISAMYVVQYINKFKEYIWLLWGRCDWLQYVYTSFLCFWPKLQAHRLKYSTRSPISKRITLDIPHLLFLCEWGNLQRTLSKQQTVIMNHPPSVW